MANRLLLIGDMSIVMWSIRRMRLVPQRSKDSVQYGLAKVVGDIDKEPNQKENSDSDKSVVPEISTYSK